MTISMLRPEALPAERCVRLHAADRLINIHSSNGASLLEGCLAAVELSDGTVYTTDSASSVYMIGETTEVRTPGDHARPELRWDIRTEDDGRALRFRLAVKNSTNRALSIERLDVLVAPGGFRQVQAWDLEAGQMGWQSWSRSHPPMRLSPDDLTAPPPVIGPMLSATELERTVLPWMGLLRSPDGHSLLAGFTTARDQAGVIFVEEARAGHRLAASCYCEGLSLHPGDEMRSETLLLVFDQSEESSLERYARTLATEMEARAWPGVPTGWCSWYYFFTEVSEEDVLRNLEHLNTERHRMPVEYVQLDDGYQTQIGDWLTLNSKFPSGMRFLTDAIRSKGYKPGLWFAPFLVSEFSEVYAKHPDWVLRDEQGQPINAIWNWHCHNYALDITHPEAAAWLRHVTRTMVNDWGYDYLKIDFIYAGALRGKRYASDCTSVQAYRRALEIIREEAGDRFILGCGAPFAPSVGLVDGMRVGPDVAPFWRDERDIHCAAPALSNAVRCTLAHTWMHGHLWVNDPDCLLVRERNSSLTLPEVQSWTSIVGMSGGMALLSDDLSRLEPERAALIPLVLPVLGESARPVGESVDGIPSGMQLVIAREWERWLAATMFNWESESRSLLFDPSEWDLPGVERYHLFDLWTGDHFGPCNGPVALPPTPAHGARQLAVHTDLGRPQVVGSTLHLLGGAVELAGDDWLDNTLTLRLDCPGEHEGALMIYVPPAYEYQPGLMTHGAAGAIRKGNLLIVPVRLLCATTITLAFKRWL